ncbi:MAG: hypothetical protein ACFE68_10195, partial [Candidatus Hodarchaeota archaeon]
EEVKPEIEEKEEVKPEIEEKEEVKIEDYLKPSITPEPSELEPIVPQDSLIKPSSLIEPSEPAEEAGRLTTSIQRQKYLAMIMVKDDGTKEPVKFSRSNLTSDRGIIVIDDVHEVVYVWMGSEISFIMRSILSRESHSIVRFGLSVGPFKIGAGFTRRVLEEAFLDTEEGKEKAESFFELFNIPIEWKGPYAVVQVEEVKTHVLDHLDFAEAAESLEAHLEEALLVIEGLTERSESERAVDVLRRQKEEERRKARLEAEREIMAARVDLLEGAALLSLLQLYPNGSVQRKAEREEGVRSIFLYNEIRELIANIKAQFDSSGRAVFLESMFPDEDDEVKFLETFGQITKTIGTGGPL